MVAIPSPGDLPHPGMDLRSPALQEDSLLTELPGMLISSGLEVRKLRLIQVKLLTQGSTVSDLMILSISTHPSAPSISPGVSYLNRKFERAALTSY